jgi:hypothetical protein
MDFFIHMLLNEEKALIVNLGSTQFWSIIPQGLPLAFKWTMVIEPTQLTGISPPALFRLMILESAMFRTLLGVMMFVRVYLPVCRLLLLLPLMLNMLPLILAWIPLLTLLHLVFCGPLPVGSSSGFLAFRLLLHHFPLFHFASLRLLRSVRLVPLFW